jgi:hypothetical protein
MATSAIGAIGNFFTGGASARKQYQYQSKLMDKQNQQQIDFWKMNNEYNTPFNQRARLEQAGLNPDLNARITPGTRSRSLPVQD